MNELDFNLDLVSGYQANTQKIRVLTENWLGHHSYCPCCGNPIIHYENNRPVADFYCKKCKEDFELKSKRDTLGSKVTDGAYQTMIERLKSSQNPNFFFMIYQNYSVKDLILVPKHFFVEETIEKRKPLSPTARRAGWVGCNIILRQIPESGKIYYVKNKDIQSPQSVLEQYRKTVFLSDKRLGMRGWTLDVMLCIEKLPTKVFKLDDIYKFEAMLQAKHPENHFIKDKIRQQLQYLRDKGYLAFNGRGIYERL